MKAPARLVISSASSSSGKTAVSCLISLWARQQGIKVAAFKCGPDFIDTQYLEASSGNPAWNLDEWMSGGPKSLMASFSQGCGRSGLALAEGAMGLFDGKRDAPFGALSTASTARLLGAPVVLVMSAKKSGVTLAAQVLGLAKADPRVKVAGVVLNEATQKTHDLIAPAIRKLCKIEVLGYLPRLKELEVPERHLGLTALSESGSFAARLKAALAQAEKTIHFKGLLKMAQAAPAMNLAKAAAPAKAKRARIGLARDAAFHFYYRENLSLLEAAGAELVEFSPLKDKFLPEGLQGLILGGGFPEIFGEELAANEFLRRELASAVSKGLPCWAECGGLMYLCGSLTDLKGKRHAMAGVLPADVLMTRKLQNFGYAEARASKDQALLPKGAALRGHEFHHSETYWRERPKEAWSLSQAGKAPRKEGALLPRGLASYFHAHLASHPGAAENFVRLCSNPKKR